MTDPSRFDSFRYDECGEKHDGKCIDINYGIKDDKAKIQALRYKKTIWTESSARSHCKTRDGTFTPAGASDSVNNFMEDGTMKIFAFTHNSTTDANEPTWGSVDKTKLPQGAFADEGHSFRKSTWKYPHHWVKNGGGEDQLGVYTTGTMYLHRGGLAAAWSAANGGRSGEQASQAVKDHLNAHRKAIGMGDNQKKASEGISWYEFRSQTEIPELWIYDEIGAWGIGALDFIAELNAVESLKIDMHINSPGGNVFDGAAIYNAIKRHPATVTTYIDGLAASIASVIALAGKKVYMAENAVYMMHNPWGLVMGNAEDMRKQADVLDKVRDTMLGAYVSKSGKTQDEVKALLDAETWMNSDEALASGFVDEISGKMDLAACAKFISVMAKLGFKRIPKAFNLNRAPSAREIERALRDVGCSAKQAKVILATGYSDDPRDEDYLDITPLEAASQRDVGRLNPPGDDSAQRDAGRRKPIVNDKTAELLIKADLVSQ